MESGERLLKSADVAWHLNISEDTVRRWLRDGKIRGIRLGGTKLGWRIPESEVRRLLQEAQPDA